MAIPAESTVAAILGQSTPILPGPNTSGATPSAMEAVTFGLHQAAAQIAAFLPKLIAAAIVVAAGNVVAWLVARLVSVMGERLGLQRAAQRSGLTDSLAQSGIERPVSQLLGAFVFWLLMCVFLVAACDILQLPGVAVALERLAAYLPKVLLAAIIVVVGFLLAAMVRSVVAASLTRAQFGGSAGWASAAYYALVVVTLIGALRQMDVEFELLNYAILIVLAGAALAFGLSFGLGGRDVMAGVVCGYYLRQRFQAGDHVRVAGYEGTIREVGVVATVIETEEGGMLNRHSIPNQRMLSESIR